MEQAIPIATSSTFIAKLLAPIAAPADTKEARLLARDRKRALERAWSLVHHRYYAAHAYSDHCSHLRRAAEIERRSLKVPEAATDAQAWLAMVSAIDAMMHVPAPTIGALRLKQKLARVGGGRDRWNAAIAIDIADLGCAA